MLTIGVLSKRTGCHVETIRYYERIGLLPPPPRSDGGHRLYDTDHLRRLTFVRRGRDLGFSLEEIRELLNLVDTDGVVCRQVRERTLAQVSVVRDKIAELQRIERTLVEMAALCDDDQRPDCPIIDRLFEAPATAH